MWGTVYLPRVYWEFVDQWDGDTPSQKIRNALDDLERFRPHGPGAKPREAGGRFKKHPPTLLERSIHPAKAETEP